ncbi:MAG: MBL fold metallo-hydrolase [Ruminococcaceae bacterium]|nr:MBL fold metallo-hydrolase [Oscillospiraceae bacterium]
MIKIEKINDNIYRTVTPYKDIWTTMYIVKTEKGDLLFDAASFDEDAQNYIVPFLKECGVTSESLKYIFISHDHSDHAGGLGALMEYYPDAVILSRSTELRNRFAEYDVIPPQENEVFLDVLKTVTITGHTSDCAGLYDVRTKTLITGDCLQVGGIVGSENWAANIRFPVCYFEDIEKVRKMDIDLLLTAHDYYPFGYKAKGKEEINRYLDGCREPLLKLKKLILENPTVDDEGICDIHNVSKDIPTFHAGVVKYVRKAMKKKRF